MNKRNFLGVLGGMGPLATADFLKALATRTVAAADQDHIPILLYGDCTTPDRTFSIVAGGPSPLPKLLEGVAFLNQANVGAICIPCNSAHHWFSELQAASKVPILHIGRASVSQIKTKAPDAKIVGVLSTEGTHQSGIYLKALAELGYKVVTPSPEEFASLVSPGIALIKSNNIREAERLFDLASSALIQRGAESIILGCTEIPIGMRLQTERSPMFYVDSTEALALSAIEMFLTQLR